MGVSRTSGASRGPATLWIHPKACRLRGPISFRSAHRARRVRHRRRRHQARCAAGATAGAVKPSLAAEPKPTDWPGLGWTHPRYRPHCITALNTGTLPSTVRTFLQLLDRHTRILGHAQPLGRIYTSCRSTCHCRPAPSFRACRTLRDGESTSTCLLWHHFNGHQLHCL